MKRNTNALLEYRSLVVVVTILAMIAACAPAAPAGAPATGGEAAAPASEIRELTFWGIGWSDEVKGMLQSQVEMFNEQNPSISVTLTPQPPSDYEVNLLLSIEAGDPPDVAEAWHELAANLAEQGKLISFEGAPSGLPWAPFCYSTLILLKDNHYEDALTFINAMRQSNCQVSNSDVEEWIPYPQPPGPDIIGDATLVPGAIPMLDGVAALRDVLLGYNVKINTARTVRLTGKENNDTTYLAPPAESEALDDLEKKLREGPVVLGVVVVDDQNALIVVDDQTSLSIPEGPYVELGIFIENEDKFKVQLINSSREAVTELDMDLEELGSRYDEHPVAGIFFGSEKCRSCGWWCSSNRC